MALTKPYILVGGIVLFVALLFFFTKLPEIKPEEEEEVTAIVEEKPAASIWKRRQFGTFRGRPILLLRRADGNLRVLY